ncbi:hypothetical protein [Streptomyces pseudovenezuelae]|uniref:hypothetical protein n=1 Tax=Streptomyces pseudovenezuelae TaxID=67350 RepID=UPI0036E30A42
MLLMPNGGSGGHAVRTASPSHHDHGLADGARRRQDGDDAPQVEFGQQMLIVEGEGLDALGECVDGLTKVGDLLVAGTTCLAELTLEFLDAFAQGRRDVGAPG